MQPRDSSIQNGMQMSTKQKIAQPMSAFFFFGDMPPECCGTCTGVAGTACACAIGTACA